MTPHLPFPGHHADGAPLKVRAVAVAKGDGRVVVKVCVGGWGGTTVCGGGGGKGHVFVAERGGLRERKRVPLRVCVVAIRGHVRCSAMVGGG